MGRYIIAVIIIGLHLASIPVYGGTRKTIAPPQNVILIVVDTLAANHLGFMGYDRNTSPFIDSLASESIVFDRAYTPKSTTEPSFASLLSGQHPLRHGVIENGINIPEELHFLTSDLQEVGFRTWGIPAARVIGMQYGLNKGFDYYANAPAIPHSTPEISERLERILISEPMLGEPSLRDSEKPLFLMLHFYDVHTPFEAEKGILDEFISEDYTGPVDGSWEQFKLFNEGALDLSPEDLKHASDLYDAEIRTFDSNLQRVFSILDRAGLLDTSIIIFTADHGENLGEHNFVTHGHAYENSLRIPLFIKFPSHGSSGMTISTPVEITDIFPTILELYCVERPENLDGRSLVPLMFKAPGENYNAREFLFAIGGQSDFGRTYSAFDGQYRLLVDTGKGEGNIYDVLIDPAETNGLIEFLALDKSELVDFLEESILQSQGLYAGNHAMDDETVDMLASLGYLNNK